MLEVSQSQLISLSLELGLELGKPNFFLPLILGVIGFHRLDTPSVVEWSWSVCVVYVNINTPYLSMMVLSNLFISKLV